MTFYEKKGRGFYSELIVHTTQVVARKLNGYVVINDEGNRVFLCSDDIHILDISESEKNMPIEL